MSANDDESNAAAMEWGEALAREVKKVLEELDIDSIACAPDEED